MPSSDSSRDVLLEQLAAFLHAHHERTNKSYAGQADPA